MRRYVARLDAARDTLARELEDEIAPLRGLSLEERARWVAGACAAAWTIARTRPDFAEIVSAQEPPSADFDEKWAALMARRRRAGESTRS